MVLADTSIVLAMLKREREQRSGEISNLLNFIKVKTGKKVGVTPTVRREVSGVWGPRLEEKFEEKNPLVPPDVGRVRSLFERIASDPAGREKLDRLSFPALIRISGLDEGERRKKKDGIAT